MTLSDELDSELGAGGRWQSALTRRRSSKADERVEEAGDADSLAVSAGGRLGPGVWAWWGRVWLFRMGKGGRGPGLEHHAVTTAALLRQA